eukprot:Rhum_TRINITY_DN21539_c0_g1::Rhum_TRINITY_DN21539_c0_g1_i1::g.174177::m.174177
MAKERHRRAKRSVAAADGDSDEAASWLARAVFAALAVLQSLWIALCRAVLGPPKAAPVDAAKVSTFDEPSVAAEAAAAPSADARGRLPFRYAAVRESGLGVAHLVRHGAREDHGNAGWRRSEQGRTYPDDPPLSVGGLLQARETATFFKEMRAKSGLRPHVVVSSPFHRTLQTATEIAEKLGVPLVVEPGLSEFLCKKGYRAVPKLRGSLSREGEACPAVDAAYVPVCDSLPAYPEKEKDAASRFDRVVSRIVDANPNAVIVFVTHRFGVEALCDLYLRRLKSSGIRQVPYCSVTSLERRPPTRTQPERTWSYHMLAHTQHLTEATKLYFKR